MLKPGKSKSTTLREDIEYTNSDSPTILLFDSNRPKCVEFIMNLVFKLRKKNVTQFRKPYNVTSPPFPLNSYLIHKNQRIHSGVVILLNVLHE